MQYFVDVFSFFSGLGFLDLGFETMGNKVVFANELFNPFASGYHFSRERMKMTQPIYGIHVKSAADYLTNKSDHLFLESKIKDSRQQNKLVSFIAGPPCPDFSIGGKNRGRNGDNGRLSESYMELIKMFSPDLFLFENVKGLWRTKMHRTFYEEMKHSLITSGYILTERLINSIEYGVPQDRDRIILLGFKKALIGELGFAKSVNNGILHDDIFPWHNFIRYNKEQVFAMAWPEIDDYSENAYRGMPKNIPVELTVEHWFRRNNVEGHTNQGHYFMPRAGLIRFQSVAEGDVSKKSYKRLHRWRYSPTAAYGNNEVHIHPYKSRRISVAEALSIQSLPRQYELPDTMTLSAMFKGVGNGVPFLAAQGIANSIQYFLGREDNVGQKIDHERACENA